MGVYLLSDEEFKPKKMWRIGLVFGIAGVSTAMMIYQACDGEHYPWRAMGAAGLIGIRIDRMIRNLLEKFRVEV